MTDLSIILAPVSRDSPCGENLYEDMGYEGRFAVLVAAGMGIAAESFVEGERAKSSAPSGQQAWTELQDGLVDLFRQTKHLDMLYLLALSNGHLNGVVGMTEGIDYTNNLLANNWDSIHPVESEGDYEYRQNCIKKMDSAAFADALNSMIIADCRQLGKYTLGAWLDAKKFNSDDLKLIETALVETLKETPSYYDNVSTYINELQESMGRLELTIKDNFVNFRLTFKILKSKLAEIAQLIAGFSDVAIEGMENNGGSQSGKTSGSAKSGNSPDQINSREDVIKNLAKIILFYNKNEPTSPVPIMLERAQRVANMNFKEIVQEFNLSGTPSIQEVLGWKSEENQF